jgi:hypothetical protein
MGNAPTMGTQVFWKTASGFLINYQPGATGFTTPIWPIGNGDYPCYEIGPTTTTPAPTTTTTSTTTAAPTTTTTTTPAPTTPAPTTTTTAAPTTATPTTVTPTTATPTTATPTTATPTTVTPTTATPTTATPTTATPTTQEPTTIAPTTVTPTNIYYVDLSQIDPGAGTELSPFNYTQFIAQVPSSGDVFKLKGSIILPGDLIFGDGGTPFDIVAWDLEAFGPWRIKGVYGTTYNMNFFVSATGHISGGIIDSPNWLRMSGIVSNLFIYAYSGFQLFQSNCTLNGCTLFVYNPVFNHTSVNDCIIIGVMGNCSGSVFNNCVFTATRLTGATTNNCQFGWDAPELPAWDAERSAFSENILYVHILSLPQPGNPPYIGYDVGLWGTTRNGIGAMDFVDSISTSTTTSSTTVPPFAYSYVDLSRTSGSGTESDPYGYVNWAALDHGGEILRVRGKLDTGEYGFSPHTPSDSYSVEAWNLELYGPWRIYSSSGSVVIQTLLGNVSGGMIYANGIEIASQNINTCFLKSTDSFNASSIIEQSGCIVIASTINVNQDSIINDCILAADSFVNDATYNNCVFSASSASGVMWIVSLIGFHRKSGQIGILKIFIKLILVMIQF